MVKTKYLLLVFSQNIFVCLVDFSPPHSKYYPRKNVFSMYTVCTDIIHINESICIDCLKNVIA